jgi:hypothetical protein
VGFDEGESTTMLTQDIDGKLWHRGTKLGLIYAVIAFIVFGVTMTQDPEGPLAWLSNFGPLLILAPLAAASHAYVAGRRDQLSASVNSGQTTTETTDGE